MATDIGHGATIAFGTTVEGNLVAEMTSISWSGIARTAVPGPHMGETAGIDKVFSTQYDAGTLSVTANFDTVNTIIDNLWNSAAETITLTIPDGGDALSVTWVATGAVTSCEVTMEDEGIITMNLEIALSGDVTITVTPNP